MNPSENPSRRSVPSASEPAAPQTRLAADARERAAALRLARGRRLWRLRRRIAGGALATFVLAWSGLFVQMATGHDPALDHKHVATSTGATSTNSSSSSEGSSSSSSSGESSGASSLTTGQS